MYKDAKLLWVDAHIDANTPSTSPSKNAHGMPLAYLSGMVPFQKQWQCVDIGKDICYFGIRSYEEEEEELIKDRDVLVFQSDVCLKDNINQIENKIDNYFNTSKNSFNHFWISFDIDGVDAREFEATGTAENEGLTLDFMESFFTQFTNRSVGMDFTEVNFELASSLGARLADEQTFRQIFELIVHQANQPLPTEENYKVPFIYEGNRATVIP